MRLSLAVSLSLFTIASATASLVPSEAQSKSPSKAQPGPRLPRVATDLVIDRHVEAGRPFTVAGPQGVVLGQQEGTFEAWILPVKLLSHFALRAEVEGYPVPIDLQTNAAEIEVRPDRTIITYSHLTFTIRQTMFAPENVEDGTGAYVVFEVDSVRPLDLTFSFTPEMRPMWPMATPGTPSAEWVESSASTPGLYLLHTDNPALTGAVSIPGAKPGIMAPYQEKPQVHPLELHLHVDPAKDRGRMFPLLLAVGQTAETAAGPSLAAKLAHMEQGLPATLAAHQAAYTQMQQLLTTIETPDAGLDDAFRWATVSIEQLRAKSRPEGQIGLVAGYYSSGDSARPGFGWYFGRDTLYTLSAVDGMGDFALARQALEFLLARQRADGKMMHEYSQTAAFVDWKSFPYEYAAADATPLFLTTLASYLRISGDTAFVKAHADAIRRAWTFETTHDSDGDGIYDNVQGTGWVESWPGGMPHQEIYLALLDQEASAAMAKLATVLGDAPLSQAALDRANSLRTRIEQEYFQPASGLYAFSHNADGSVDRTRTIYPALAWWYGGPGLAHPEPSLRAFASHDLSTDWGTRDVAESDPVYDPISYHQGSVWPLFTGWAALAEYRSGRPLSGYAHLMQNAEMTWSQDLGAVTELLSGAFFQPFGRSTSHQLWSSAMVITPALQGLFGLDVDGAAHVVHLAPNLPASWPGAQIRTLHVGDSVANVRFTREGSRMVVLAETVSGSPVRLAAGADGKPSASVSFALPAIEVEAPHTLPLPGARTAQMKVLSQAATPRSLMLELEGQGGSTAQLTMRRNRPNLKVSASGATTSAPGPDGLIPIAVRFPDGTGYTSAKVILSW